MGTKTTLQHRDCAFYRYHACTVKIPSSSSFLWIKPLGMYVIRVSKFSLNKDQLPADIINIAINSIILQACSNPAGKHR